MRRNAHARPLRLLAKILRTGQIVFTDDPRRLRNLLKNRLGLTDQFDSLWRLEIYEEDLKRRFIGQFNARTWVIDIRLWDEDGPHRKLDIEIDLASPIPYVRFEGSRNVLKAFRQGLIYDELIDWLALQIPSPKHGRPGRKRTLLSRVKSILPRGRPCLEVR